MAEVLDTFYWGGKRLLNRLYNRNPDSFFKKISGIIHVGANEGQERFYYAACGLHVIWVEPIPEVFQRLQDNIQNYSKQKAYQYLLTDQNDTEHEFRVIGDDGESSSIYALAQHQDIWPEIQTVKTLAIKSKTLPTMLANENIDLSNYQGLVLDTQGSELLVLRGSQNILSRFTYIKAEAADFNAYEGCCQLNELVAFLKKYSFIERKRSQFANHPNGGGYYDLIFSR